MMQFNFACQVFLQYYYNDNKICIRIKEALNHITYMPSDKPRDTTEKFNECSNYFEQHQDEACIQYKLFNEIKNLVSYLVKIMKLYVVRHFSVIIVNPLIL